MKTETPPTIRLADYRKPAYRIISVDLDFRLDPQDTRVRARLEIEAAHADAGPLHLDGEALKLISIAVDGKALGKDEYDVTRESLTLKAPPPRFVLETEVAIDPSANSALSGLYVSDGMMCTQCEAEGFRRITYYPDRPDVMAPFRVRLEADAAAYPLLLSNGNLLEAGPLAGGRHFALWEDPFKKPAYLFALVAGRLAHIEDHFTTMSGRRVVLRVYVDPGNEARAAYAMDSLKRSMKWDEEAYGREYDLDIFMIVAVSAFNFGAMENKGLNIFNDKLVLASPETATDTDYALIEGVVGHEYFHNWSGNRITCRDWFQLCLKEGFTVLRDQQFSADMRSADVKLIEEVKLLRLRQFAEDGGPLAHPVRPESYIEIDNFYTATVYEKGAQVCRMLHTLLGPQLFRKATDLYFDRHDGEAATVEDFAACFEAASGMDLTQFRLWWSQAGTPELHIIEQYDAAAQSLTLTLRQTCPPTPGQPEKKPFHIPVRIGLVGQDGTDRPLQLEGENAAQGTTRVLSLTQAEQRFTFTGLSARPKVSALRGFSAPVKLQLDRPSEDAVFLMGRDPDRFNRWDVGQQLAAQHILALADGRAAAPDAAIIAAFGHVLDDTSDPAFTALAVALPSEGDLALLAAPGTVDPARIQRARQIFLAAIGAAHKARFEALESARPSGAYDPGIAQSGARALANVALRYLTASGGPDAARRAKRAFDSATNMTDQMAALSVLSDLDAPERTEALDAFATRWADVPLVMDKWLSVQAVSARAGTHKDVQRLTAHPAFSHQNPNRFRSLINQFAMNNPAGFHDASGAGYRLTADQALIMDKINPQVAARLFGAFEGWRRYTPALQAMMRTEIERVASANGLSKNLFEIAQRCRS